ncbi:hypothetical protein C8R44DRAFT_384284 [Mycena epipterygia]|nr:hypothetical protein C8R44DRAFT_384284 [Mycena epipterygia]
MQIYRIQQKWNSHLVLTLPHNLTSEIFLQCLPPSPVFSGEFEDGPHPLEAPLLLLHICKIWRSIAISTPHLWASLHLNLADIPESFHSSPELEDFIADWFSQAGSCPLSFSVDWSSMGDFGGKSLNTAILRHAPRLQSLALKLAEEQLEDLPDLSGPFPLLEKLAICFPDMTDGTDRTYSEFSVMCPVSRKYIWASIYCRPIFPFPGRS